MTRFSLFLVAVLLLLVTCHARDPGCKRGIKSDGACCPSKCGKCGGVGCGTRGRRLNTLCCKRAIKNTAKFCFVAGPPCKLVGSRGSTRPRAEGNGMWRTAPVNSGGLTARHEACAVMVRGLVVLLGGRGNNKPVSIYNPKTATWVNKDGPGSGIEIHHVQCVATTSGKIYIATSWTGGYPNERNNDKVFIYDVVNNRWSTRPGLPESRRRGGAAAVLRDGVIYVVGGNRGGHGAHATTYGWMDSYNIATGRWTTNLPSMPDGRDHTGGAMVNGELCVAGGRDGGVGDFFNANKKTTWCFSFVSRKWSRKGDFPRPRAGAMTGAICGGRMMIAGGEGAGDAYSRVDIFDGSKWTQAPSLVQKRHGSGLCVAQCACGQIFIPSGSGSQGGSPELTSTERFIPAGRPFNCASY